MQTTDTKAEVGFCTFYLGEKRYAIDILTVQEINRHVTITRAHGAPDYVCGLQNLRGQVVTVIDTSLTLGMDPIQMRETTCILILKTNDELMRRGFDHLRTSDDMIGLLVDDVSDVITVEHSAVEPMPAGREAPSNAVRGVIRLDAEVLRVIHPQHLLGSEEESE